MDPIFDFIEELRKSNKMIIVEGIKDKKALSEFGISSIILKKPFYKFIESIQEKEIIILTDLDKEGRKLYSMLKTEFQKRGKIIDNKFREFLFKNTSLANIEGIVTYAKKKNHTSF